MVFSQNSIDLKAEVNPEKKQIKISQTIVYQNISNKVLDTIYLNDWNQAYATKITPLAKRFAEEYKTEFHFAKSKDRGFTAITSITQNNQKVFYERVNNHPDVIKVVLNSSLQPNESYKLSLNYIVQVPNVKFTDYGINSFGDFNLRYWYITPAEFDGKWQYYSNKNLDDLLIPESSVRLNLVCPNNYAISTELK